MLTHHCSVFATNAANLNITNSIFGPSMATDGSAGSKLQLYTPGAKGSVLLNGASTVLSVAGSYKTNFAYTPIGADAKNIRHRRSHRLQGFRDRSLDKSSKW